MSNEPTKYDLRRAELQKNTKNKLIDLIITLECDIKRLKSRK